MKGPYFLSLTVFSLYLCVNAQIVTDADGNSYTTVAIGSQVWMKENLKTTRYNDHTPIADVADSIAWTQLSTGAYCDYQNDTANGSTYGRLYNWYSVNDPRGICPPGWHVPTDSEWSVLTRDLGGDNIAGGAMKDVADNLWTLLDTGATNSSGFTALPSGDRHYMGPFVTLGYYAFWWSSSEYDAADAWQRNVNYNNVAVGRSSVRKTYGLSVRCIRNLPNGTQMNSVPQPAVPGICLHVAGKRVVIECARNGNYAISVYNCIGRSVFRGRAVGGRKEIDVRPFQGGLYVLRVSNPAGEVYRQVFCIDK